MNCIYTIKLATTTRINNYFFNTSIHTYNVENDNHDSTFSR